MRWEPEVQGLLPAESVHVSLAHTESSNGSHFARTLAVLGRTVYLRPTPALRGGALHSKFAVSAQGDRTEATKIESEFVTSSVAVADDLLSKQAVSELRAFCEDSTFFHKNYIQARGIVITLSKRDCNSFVVSFNVSHSFAVDFAL